jgi:hypothetical protein
MTHQIALPKTAIGMVRLYRICMLAGAAIVLLLVTTRLTAYQQGAFFLLQSIYALQIFIELGFSQLLLTQVSRNKRIPGNQSSRENLVRWSNIVGLWRIALKVLAFAGFIACLVVIVALSTNPLALSKQSLINTQLVVVMGFSIWLSLVGTFFLAFMEGLGYPTSAYLNRTLQVVLLWGLTGLGIILGLGSASLVWAHMASWLTAALLLARHFFPQIKSLVKSRVKQANPKFARTLLHLQWRTAISALSGYLLISSLVPLTAYYQGLVEAGRVGATLQVFNALGLLGSVHLSSQIAGFGTLAGQGNLFRENPLYKTAVKRTMLESVALAFLACCFIMLLEANGHWQDWRNRFVVNAAFCAAAISMLANQYGACRAAYLRAFGSEPLMLVSLLHGLSTVVMAWAFVQISLDFSVFWALSASSLTFGAGVIHVLYLRHSAT